jgi:PKD repeat protein
MKITGNNILLAGIAVLLLLVGIVSADSDYCTPPTGLNVTVTTDGSWQNITIDSDTCIVWTDTGYGNISGTPCDNTAPGHIEKLTHTQNCTSITWEWIDPTDLDFDHVMIYQDGAFLHNITAGIETDIWSGLTHNTSYTISTLTVDSTGNYDDTDWINHTVSTTSCAPIANFTGTPLDICMYDSVTFTDTSENNPTAWLWNFGDGTGNIPGQNQIHMFNITGLFDVSLKVGNAYGDNTTTKEDYVNVTDCNIMPVASFTSNVTCGIVPFAAQFVDTSAPSNATDWFWMFGDGNTSVAQNPIYQYNITGVYTINFSVTNSIGTSWSNITDYITARPLGDTCAGGGNVTYGEYYDTDKYPGNWFNSWMI